MGSGEEALEIWRALHEGRWSLVDCFDAGGRRYLVVRKNDPAVAPLTEREREIVSLAALGRANKAIGYELGLSESTVATHLESAFAKLGVPSRTALLQAYALLGDR
jgi:DNA-binding NarL/FixJ family response regulator